VGPPSQLVLIRVAPTAEENVVRMPTTGVGWAITGDVDVAAPLMRGPVPESG
jgi:hypothetical protein